MSTMNSCNVGCFPINSTVKTCCALSVWESEYICFASINILLSFEKLQFCNAVKPLSPLYVYNCVCIHMHMYTVCMYTYWV